MNQIGWRLLQVMVFGALFFGILFGGRNAASAPSGKDAGGVLLIAGALTLVLFGIVNQIQNWLIRRRAGMVGSGANLAQEPDHDRNRLGRAWSMSEEPAEVIEVARRENPRKLGSPFS